MSLVCAQCQRRNPADAVYCYLDGAPLTGRGDRPIDAGARLFVAPFVFPDGMTCRNFDQLATVCHQQWANALTLLKQNFLGAFLGSIGRADLALAAREAAAYPDADRGLDQLLGKFPSSALQPPKLQVEPSAINMGVLQVGADRAFDLHLTNAGMRLIFGTATSDCAWLTLGDAPGQPGKLFQFGSEAVIRVHVRGLHLRAQNKPLAGKLVIESNAGTVTVAVRADVPVKPFADGLCAGAVTPRQIAEKAKAHPKETAVLFENGAIAKWYAVNGWQYPVQGPAMTGLAGIQQFFEALGVTKPPAVAFSSNRFEFQADAGQTYQSRIEVTASDTGKRKVVYGWATCDQPWVEIGRTEIVKASAFIPITFRIPTACAPLLTADIKLFGNGNQKIVAPVRITVAGAAPVRAPEPAEFIEVEMIQAPATAIKPMPAIAPTPAPAFAADSLEFTNVTSDLVARARRRTSDTGQLAMQIMPMVLLLGLVGLLLARDGFYGLSDTTDPIKLFGDPKKKGGKNEIVEDAGIPADVDLRPVIRVKFDEGFEGKEYTDSMTFAVHKLGEEGQLDTRLNWYQNGFGNSTVARIDGVDYTFGLLNFGRWYPKEAKPAGRYGGGKMRTFEFAKSGIRLTQTVTIEPGEPAADGPGKGKRPLNVCLVKYTLHNNDADSHRVGLRTLLDTCIGENDGVPFTIPGENQLVDTFRDFTGNEVPDFVQVLEKGDLADPGIIVHLNMRLAPRLEMPSRFSLTRYPEAVNRLKDLKRWDVPILPIGDDSCVVMYWEEKELKPDARREVAFSYGLGNLSVYQDDTPTKSAGRLGLSIGGGTYVDGELTVLALIADPDARTATLSLPAGLTLLNKKQSLAQNIARPARPPNGKPRPVPVTWRVRALTLGNHEVTVATDTKLRQTRSVTIRAKSLFN